MGIDLSAADLDGTVCASSECFIGKNLRGSGLGCSGLFSAKRSFRYVVCIGNFSLCRRGFWALKSCLVHEFPEMTYSKSGELVGTILYYLKLG